MQSLLKEIKKVQNSNIKEVIEQRLYEFSSFHKKSEKEWFSELCFCILTANAKQKTGDKIQQVLGPEGFLTKSQTELANIIKENKHRFHNNKARYIVKAREFSDIKKILKGKEEQEARDFIVKNIKGLGMKEASHFLRNTGSRNLAILDRHILNLMHEHKIIEKPTSLNKKKYLEIESKFNEIAEKLNISSAKLDLLMWYMKTGEVAK